MTTLQYQAGDERPAEVVPASAPVSGPDRLSAGAGRRSCARRRDGAAVPWRRLVDGRRIFRCVGVLHALGLFDHVVAVRRIRVHLANFPIGVLRAPRETVAAGKSAVPCNGVDPGGQQRMGRRDTSQTGSLRLAQPGGQLGAVVRRRELRRRAEQNGRTPLAARSLLVAGHRRTVLLDLARCLLGAGANGAQARRQRESRCWRLHRRVRSVRPDHCLGVGERRRVLGNPGTCRRDSARRICRGADRRASHFAHSGGWRPSVSS